MMNAGIHEPHNFMIDRGYPEVWNIDYEDFKLVEFGSF